MDAVVIVPPGSPTRPPPVLVDVTEMAPAFKVPPPAVLASPDDDMCNARSAEAADLDNGATSDETGFLAVWGG